MCLSEKLCFAILSVQMITFSFKLKTVANIGVATSQRSFLRGFMCEASSLTFDPMRYYLIFIAIVLSFVSSAQQGADRILMMNGKVINAQVLGQSTLGIRYNLYNKRGVFKEFEEATVDVFSVMDSLGNEKVWYFHDPQFGNDMTLSQMRSFIKGEQDARDGYKPFWTTLGGFVFGSGVTLLMETEVISFALPPLYAGAMVLPRIHITPGSVKDPRMNGSEDYAYGYSEVAKSRRVVRGLIAAFAGVAVGLTVNEFRQLN